MNHAKGPAEGRIPPPVTLSILLGTVLNPLNSSMIAVALIPLARDFGATLPEITWLISGFYLSAAAAQPLMGRLADHFGPRRVFLAGVGVVGVVGALAPLAPALSWLVLARVLQAVGSSAPYPAGLAVMRRLGGGARIPAGALASLSIGGSVCASLGPTLGGLLLALAGWRGIFEVNVLLAAAGVAAGLAWLPKGSPRSQVDRSLASLDLPGAALFALALVTLLDFLLSFERGPNLLLLPVSVAAGLLLVVRELRVREPFIDLRMLATNRVLVNVYLQFALVTLVFYSFFFALPIWLEQVRGISAQEVGLIVLPITGMSILVTPVGARLAARRGPRPTLVIGSAALLAATLPLSLFGPTTPVALIVASAIVIGLPNGFNNMGLQAALYSSAPEAQMGAAAGQFQTFRFLGAILSSTLLGVGFGGQATTAGLHRIALVLAAISVLVLLASILLRRPGPGARPEDVRLG